MNLNLTERQKTLLVSALLTLFVVVGAIFGYEVKTAPLPKPTQETEIGAQSLQNTGIKCGASADPCVVSNWGRDINVYSDEQSTSKFSVDGATGDTTVAGALAVTGAVSASSITNSGGQANSNYFSVSAPTAVASATPAVRINSLGANNDLLVVEKNSTPVFKVGNSGALTISGAVSVSGAINGVKCVNGTQNVIGSATAIPATLTAAGIATPSFVQASLGTDATGDGVYVTNTRGSGVVTFKIWNSALTPAAATTVVAVDYTVCGN